MEGKRKLKASSGDAQKRLKKTGLVDENPGLLPGLPEVLDTMIASCLTLEDLQTLRGVSRQWKQTCTQQMKNHLRSELEKNESTVTIELDEMGQQFFSFHSCWPKEMSSRDNLIQTAMGYADPGGQVSLNADVDPEEAEDLLRRRGFVTVMDFLEDESYRAEASYHDVCEVGWAVRFRYVQEVKKRKTWKRLAKWIKKARGDDDYPTYRNDLPELESIRAHIFTLFASARSSSIRYAMCEYEYPHTDYASGGKKEAILFRSEDGSEAAICYENHNDAAI